MPSQTSERLCGRILVAIPTAIPDDHDGEFKIVGLNAGTYKVIIDGQNGYIDTTISNVIVRNREDTHLPTITLHQ